MFQFTSKRKIEKKKRNREKKKENFSVLFLFFPSFLKRQVVMETGAGPGNY